MKITGTWQLQSRTIHIIKFSLVNKIVAAWNKRFYKTFNYSSTWHKQIRIHDRYRLPFMGTYHKFLGLIKAITNVSIRISRRCNLSQENSQVQVYQVSQVQLPQKYILLPQCLRISCILWIALCYYISLFPLQQPAQKRTQCCND